MTNEETLNDMLKKTFPRTIFIRGINELNKTQSIVFSDEWLKMPYMAINALQTEPCEDCISRQAVNDLVDELARAISDERCCIPRGRSTATIMQDIIELPSVQPEPKKGYMSIADVMSVFDDFMCGEVDEDGTETFLEMLKDKAESEGKESVKG